MTAAGDRIALTEADFVFACAATAARADAWAPLHDDPERVAAGRLSDRTRAVAELFPRFRYRRPKPTLIVAPSRDFARNLERHFDAIDGGNETFPATILCESADIRFGYDVLYYDDHGDVRVLYETCRPNDRDVVRGPDGDCLRADATFAADAVYLLLDSAGSFNYGHWLVDDLPRLEAFFVLERLHRRTPITILLSSHNVLIDEVRRRSIILYLAGRRNFRIQFLDRAHNHRFARLYHVTPSSLHPIAKSPASLRAMTRRLRRNTWYRRAKARLRYLAAEPGRALQPGGRRLFVDRNGVRGRNLLNREAVLAYLAPLGFEIVDPETMNLREQMILFSQARLVVGIMGAAMTNTVFCPLGAELLYLAAGEAWTEPFYWDLAAVGGHRYAAVFGEPAASDATMHVRAFSVDVADLDAALRTTRAFA